MKYSHHQRDKLLGRDELAGGGVAERKWSGTWSIFLSLPRRLMRSRKSTVKSTAGRFPHPSTPQIT